MHVHIRNHGRATTVAMGLSRHLHACNERILAWQYIAQFSKTWRLATASLYEVVYMRGITYPAPGRLRHLLTLMHLKAELRSALIIDVGCFVF